MQGSAGGYYPGNYYQQQGQPYMQQSFVPQQMNVEQYSAPIINAAPQVTQAAPVSQAGISTAPTAQHLSTPTSVVTSGPTPPRPALTHQTPPHHQITQLPAASPTKAPPPNTQHHPPPQPTLDGFNQTPKLIEGLPNLNQTNELIGKSIIHYD